MLDKTNSVVEALKDYQKRKNLSDGGLAAILNLDRSTLSYVKANKGRLGVKVLRAIAQKIPELRPVVVSFVVFGDGWGTSHPES